MLKFCNVSVEVSKTPILKDISVSFKEGKITAIIGPNGCGKTTLLQTLNGMSKVTSGKIFLNDEDFLLLGFRQRAKRLSFMPQFRDNNLNISVKKLVEHGRFSYMGFTRKMSKEDKSAIMGALEYTNLLDYKDKMLNELSGGLQQRVFLSMQLAQNSPYMVMDEPMNFLDFASKRDIYRLIRDLAKKGKTVVIVMHDIGQALKLADEIVVMKDRKVVACNSPKACIDSGVIEEVFDCKIKSVEVDGETEYLVI